MKELECIKCGDAFQLDWSDGYETDREMCRECERELEEENYPPSL